MAKKSSNKKSKGDCGGDCKCSCPIEPMGDRIVIAVEEKESMSPGGIVLPSGAQEPSNLAVVLAVGPGKPWLEAAGGLDNPHPRYPCSLKVGDRVVVSAYAGATVSVGEAQFTLIREEDILARVL